MDSKCALEMFNTPGKNCPLNILRKKVRNMEKICLQFVTWGGAISKYISNKITFFHYDIRAG